MAADWCLWTDKYCPTHITDVIGQDHVIDQLVLWANSSCVPHLLLHGRPGTGKTATAMSMLRSRYDDDINTNVLLLNASDERNISIMRETVTQFAQSQALKCTDQAKTYPFKTVMLDEADSLTAESQVSLQGLMDSHVENMRFILLCNYVEHVHAGLRSRCALLQFHAIGTEKMMETLKSVCDAEDVKPHQEALEIICCAAKGDLRHALTSLQCMAKQLEDVNHISQLMGWPRSSHIANLTQQGLSISERFHLLKVYQMTYAIPLQGLVEKLLTEKGIPEAEKPTQMIQRESLHCSADDPVILMAIATVLSKGT